MFKNMTKEEIIELNINLERLLDQKYAQIKMMQQECNAMREQLKHLESQIYGGVTK